MAGSKKEAPEPDGCDRSRRYHPNGQCRLPIYSVPRVVIEGQRSMEQRRDEKRGDRIWGFGIRFLCRDGICGGRSERDRARQQHRQHSNGQESKSGGTGKVDFKI